MTSHSTRRRKPEPDASASGAVISLRDGVLSATDGRVLLRVPALDLFAGDRVVITGPSGSGKSLLLSTLSGRWPAGVRFAGERTAAATRIGVVPQRGLDALHPLVPLERQLARVTGATPARVTVVLETVGLADPALRRRRPAELSGGQAQRASVALAALTDAPLILADEPTSALDHHSRDLLLALLADIVRPAQALVVATHDPAVADALATRRLQVRDGVVLESRAEATR